MSGRSSRHAGDVRRVRTPAARAYARCAGGARPSAPPRPPARPWPLHPARRRRQPASAVDDPDLGAGVPPEWSSLAVCAPASPESSSADASIPSSIPARETAKSISYKGELGSRQINPAWTPTKESRRLIGLAVEQTKNAAPLADLLAGCAPASARARGSERWALVGADWKTSSARRAGRASAGAPISCSGWSCSGSCRRGLGRRMSPRLGLSHPWPVSSDRGSRPCRTRCAPQSVPVDPESREEAERCVGARSSRAGAPTRNSSTCPSCRTALSSPVTSTEVRSSSLPQPDCCAQLLGRSNSEPVASSAWSARFLTAPACAPSVARRAEHVMQLPGPSCSPSVSRPVIRSTRNSEMSSPELCNTRGAAPLGPPLVPGAPLGPGSPAGVIPRVLHNANCSTAGAAVAEHPARPRSSAHAHEVSWCIVDWELATTTSQQYEALQPARARAARNAR